jgi:uncharacterized cupin superfamily protein
MTVIVHAEDKSGRGDGYYTKSSLKEALDVFYTGEATYYLDRDGEEEAERDWLEELHVVNGQVTFYNEDGESITIT